MRPLLQSLFVAALTVLPLAGARAQCTSNPKPTLTVTPAALTLNPTISDFNAGAIQASYNISISTKGGKHWYLCVAWDGISSWTVPGYTKSIGDFQWSLDGSNWSSLSAASVQIADGPSATTFPVYIRVLLDDTRDIPGPSPTGSYGTLIINFSAGSS